MSNMYLFGSIRDSSGNIKAFNLRKVISLSSVKLHLKNSLLMIITKLQIRSGELTASRSLRICYKFLCTYLITTVFLLGFEKQISAEVNGFFLLEQQPLYKPVPPYSLQRVKVPQINLTDIGILMDRSISDKIRTVRSSFHYATIFF